MSNCREGGSSDAACGDLHCVSQDAGCSRSGAILDRSGAASCAATSDDRFFAGMIVAGAIGPFVIPMLYFTFQSLREGRGARLRPLSSAKKAVR